MVDCVLHCVDLGLAQRYSAYTLKVALSFNVFGIIRPPGLNILEAGINEVRQDLKEDYYPRMDAEHRLTGKAKVTRLKSLTVKTLGKLKSPCLHAKGAESRGVVRYAMELAKRLPNNRKCVLLVQAGQSLLDWYDIIGESSRVVSFGRRAELFKHCVNHIVLYKEAGGHMVPKHHCFWHLTQKVTSAGNPACFATYEDETENGQIAKIGLMVHSRTFDRSVFERLELADRMHG